MFLLSFYTLSGNIKTASALWFSRKFNTFVTMKNTLLTVFACLMLTPLYALRQSAFEKPANAMAFRHLGLENGLSYNNVNCIMKDSQGFLWIATSYGLNRYDGYRFKIFTPDGSPGSIPDHNSNQLQEDAEGNIWVHTEQAGYVCYNPRNEKFRPASELLKNIGIDCVVTHFHIDKSKNLWCYNETEGAYQYDIQTKRLTHYPVKLLHNRQLCLISEDNGGILFLYNDGRIDRLDRTESAVTIASDYLPQHDGARHARYSMFTDSKGCFWIFSRENTGLWFCNPAENRWEHYTADASSPFVLSSASVYDVREDRDGNIWIATDHGGVNIINPAAGSIRYVTSDPLDARSITQNSICCIYCDNTGIIWIGTYKRGVSYYSKSMFKFKADFLTEFSNVKNFTPDVNVMTEDADGNLWLGTNSSGLIRLNAGKQSRDIYQQGAAPHSISGNTVVCLLAAGGRLYAGTFFNGLSVYDGKGFTHYNSTPYTPHTLTNNNVWGLTEGEDGLIWLGTLGGGLQSFNPQTKIFSTYAAKDSEFANETILSICTGKDGNLYMGTAVGMVVFNPRDKSFNRLTGNRRGTSKLSHLIVNQVYEDSRGLLWLATNLGVNIYDRQNDSLFMPEGNLLAHEIIHAIVEDNRNNIWLTTATGIYNFLIDKTYDGYNFTPYHYTASDGLQGQEFNFRGLIKTSSGQIIASGTRGLSLFNIEHNGNTSTPPNVVFTRLQLFNKDIQPEVFYGGRQILKQSINYAREITLGYEQNMISLSFSTMTYTFPERTRYLYRLKGFKDEYLEADGNTVTYTNLEPGKYELEVNAINGDGLQSERPARLFIVVNPPYWLSPWAYALYISVLITLLYGTYYTFRYRRREKFKLAMLEQQALQKQEIDDMKLRFFTNVGHELRTPLTLILTPIEDLMRSASDDSALSKLNIAHRNAIRLLNLVNQLLDFRKTDVSSHQLNLSTGNFVDFAKNICHSFTEFSEKKNVYLTFFSPHDDILMAFDADKMGKVLINLLSNAFKFTPEGGRVDVSLEITGATSLAPAAPFTSDATDAASAANEWLEMRVADTGIGVSDEDKPRIFERFWQSSRTASYGGSGIGLHLVREFVNLHHGSVTVLDNVGRGSVFIVRIPAVKPAAKSPQPTGQTFAPLFASPANLEAETVAESEFEESTPDADGSRAVILVVDDSDDFRLVMQDGLKAEYRVVTASDGQEAWRIIPTLQPDVIVSDVMMPNTDGNELCRLVKNDIRTSHIPFVMLTARSSEEHRIEGLESGADEYISKPFNFEILSLRIKKMLHLRQKRQESFKATLEINPGEITITSLDEQLMQKAVKYIEAHIANSELSVEELSRYLGMSRTHLYKKLLSITGKTPVEFIRIVRLKRAAQYLRESRMQVAEIAYEVGYNNPKYFARQFRDEFGMLPTAYKKEQSKNET
jgi:signal transduction histidine kinase/ligand-binding sensor domain-containing protein/DNA-binding response OmpR family regulator